MTGLVGVNVLLEGPTGTGKTYALGTLVDWAEKNGTEVFCRFVEPGLETLLGYYTDRGKPIPACLRWNADPVVPLPLNTLLDAAEKVGKLSYDSLTKLSDPTRAQNNPFEKILRSLVQFHDQRTGKDFGSVDSWGTDRVLVIDSLSALSNAAMKMQVGNKPTAAPPDYLVAQTLLMNFLRLCTEGCKCHFILLAHVSREKDEISGSIKLMTQAIGGAISSSIPPLFSDVIYTVREGASWFWDTSAMTVDLKTRNLPIAGKLRPDFGQIFDKWKARAESAKGPAVMTP